MSCKYNKLSNKKILIVDDEEVILYLLQEELEEEGFVIDTALSGEICLRKIVNCIYDLVILDINMPEPNGIEVLRCIKEFNCEIPVILHSAYPEYKQGIGLWASDAYVNKSANTEELINSVTKLLED